MSPPYRLLHVAARLAFHARTATLSSRFQEFVVTQLGDESLTTVLRFS